MINNSDILITIPTCFIEPHNVNWIETKETWVKQIKEKGYDVIFTKFDKNLDKKYELKDNFFTTSFSSDEWDDLFYKRIYYISEWISQQDNYKYIFFIDSDTFINVEKFDNEIPKIIEKYPCLNYMGCANPYEGWYPHEKMFKYIYKEKTFASGFGFMLSKEACKVLYKNFKDEDYTHITKGRDDVIVGDLMYKNGIPLLHNNSFSKESKWRKKLVDPFNVGTPHIGDKNSHVYVQHYINGHMKEVQKELKK